MLLSKLYLATGQWEKAIQQLNEVIDNSGYSLMTNTFGTFVTPFNTETWPIQRNVIWDLHRPENKLIAENKEVILGMPNRGIGSSNSLLLSIQCVLWVHCGMTRVIYWILMEYKL